jgi:hypothetical protein
MNWDADFAGLPPSRLAIASRRGTPLKQLPLFVIKHAIADVWIGHSHRNAQPSYLFTLSDRSERAKGRKEPTRKPIDKLKHFHRERRDAAHRRHMPLRGRQSTGF